MTPAKQLIAAIEADKLAEANFNNYAMYEVLKYRACVLKLKHAKSLGPAAERLIVNKYSKWLFDDQLKAKALHFAIMEKFGIDAAVSCLNEGVSIGVSHHTSLHTLLRAFSRMKPIMRADAYNAFVMFIPCDASQQTNLLQ
jgi:hypothetical protein